jgi:hypothetical protein
LAGESGTLVRQEAWVAHTEWYLEAGSFGNCNCNYGCPCQFEERPTQGHCRGIEALKITTGRFGNTRLDGLCAVLFYAFPGAVFEGGGQMQAIIDERADPGQREALGAILHGEHTDEGATHWWVFRAMCTTVHEPKFAPISFDLDIEARRAKVEVPGLMQASGRPIRNPVNGAEHRVRIDLPNGIEFEIAEIGSGSTQATGAISLDLDDSYGQFNLLRHTGRGIVRSR